MVHLVLLGDSILDNGVYAPDEPCLSAQREAYVEQVTLLALDGHVTADVLTHELVTCFRSPLGSLTLGGQIPQR